eukprot:616016-Rhodomonas_salina.2
MSPRHVSSGHVPTSPGHVPTSRVPTSPLAPKKKGTAHRNSTRGGWGFRRIPKGRGSGVSGRRPRIWGFRIRGLGSGYLESHELCLCVLDLLVVQVDPLVAPLAMSVPDIA